MKEYGWNTIKGLIFRNPSVDEQVRFKTGRSAPGFEEGGGGSGMEVHRSVGRRTLINICGFQSCSLI